MSSHSTEFGRRAVVAGLAACVAGPARAAGNDDAALRRTLDELDPKAPRAGLTALAGFREDRLSAGAAIDLDTIRRALMVDARLASAGPAERYALQIERRIGERITPAVAHAMLGAEVSALTVRADRQLRALGFARGSTGARFVAAFADLRFLYPDSDAGRDAAVADMNRALAAARARLAPDYPALPPFLLDVAARRMSAADEAARRGGYRVLPTPAAPAPITSIWPISRGGRRGRWSVWLVTRCCPVT